MNQTITHWIELRNYGWNTNSLLVLIDLIDVIWVIFIAFLKSKNMFLEWVIAIKQRRYISGIWEVQQKSSEMSLLDSENYFLSKTSKIIKIGSRSSEIGPPEIWENVRRFAWILTWFGLIWLDFHEIRVTVFSWFLTKKQSKPYKITYWLQKDRSPSSEGVRSSALDMLEVSGDIFGEYPPMVSHCYN